MRYAPLTVLGVCLLMATVGGCSSSSGAAGRPQTVSLHQQDSGRRVVVTDHSLLTVQLDSTYWHFSRPAAAMLHLVGVTVHRGTGGVPGSGNGTVTARYRATGSGQAVITAARSSCGEALGCSPSQSSYRVTVVVRG
jgi:hypothetical protein